MRPRRPPRQRVPRVAFSSRRAPASSSATARAACRLFGLPCARIVFRDSAYRASPFRAAARPSRLSRQRVPRVALSYRRAPESSFATARTAHRLFEPPRARVVLRDSARRVSPFRAAVRPRRLPRPREPLVALSHRRAPTSSSATARAARRSFAPSRAHVVFRDSACRVSPFRAAVRPRRFPRQRVPRVAFSCRRAPASSFATACVTSFFHTAVRPRRLPRQRPLYVAFSRRRALASSSATARAARRLFALPCARVAFRDSARRASHFRAHRAFTSLFSTACAARHGNAAQAMSSFT